MKERTKAVIMTLEAASLNCGQLAQDLDVEATANDANLDVDRLLDPLNDLRRAVSALAKLIPAR